MPIFFIVVLFTAWFAFARSRTTSHQSKSADNFWEMESNANNTRKTSLECLDYITIPLNLIELSTYSNDSSLLEYGASLELLTTKKIVNLTGINNTDLKLKYGSANLTLLTEYDQNFTKLAQTLNKLGSRLNELGNTHSAIMVLEYAVDCGSDISSTYNLLSNLYLVTDQSDKIDSLIKSASTLNSLMKNSIIKKLEALK
ncbi:MAG: hypothetical protein ACERKZ_12555 [Lachnotalea sp.]